MFMRGRLALFAVAFGTLLACSTATRMTDVWKEPAYTGGPKTNLLVVGGRMSAGHRRLVEDGLVAGLLEHGIRATPSYALFPTQLPSHDEAKTAVQEAGYDGLLVSTYKRIKEEAYVEPDASGTYFDWFYVGAGTVVEDQTVVFVTSLVDSRTERVLWSARTETLNPSSSEDFVTSLRKRVIPALSTAGLISPSAPAATRTKPGEASTRASR
jgi:hypothetical protein